MQIFLKKSRRWPQIQKTHRKSCLEKLDKFCGLIYRVRQLYRGKCLGMFRNCSDESVICHGLNVYRLAAKTNFQVIEAAQRRISGAIFFKKKFDLLTDLLVRNETFSLSAR